MLERSFDVVRLRGIFEKIPDFSFHLASDFPDELVSDVTSYVLLDDFGGMIFRPLEPGVYTMILFITPEGRDTWGAALVRNSFVWMFTNTDAQKIIGISTPEDAIKIMAKYYAPSGLLEDIRGGSFKQWTYTRTETLAALTPK